MQEKIRHFVYLFICAPFFLSGLALAQTDYSKSTVVTRMMAFDRNHDGKLTKDEVTDWRFHRLFDLADTNGDGVVTRDELIALAARIDAETPKSGFRGGGPGGPDGPGGFDGGPFGGPGPGPGGPRFGPDRPRFDRPGRYGSEAREVMEYVQKTYWDPRSALYVKSNTDRKPDYVWREAAAFSALVGAARNDPETYRPILFQFFNSLNGYWDSKVAIPGFEPAPTHGNGNDKYYDDNAWLVITFAEAYQLTHDRTYLARAEQTQRFVASGWDEQLGGGIWWHQAHKDDSKNTCSNGPAAVGDLMLARFEPPEAAAKLVDAARKIVDWTCAHLQSDDGLFDDRVIVATGEVKKGKLTYNSALMLRACLGLYRATGDAKYLDQAKRIGKASDAFADHNTGVYRDPLKWSHFMVEADIELFRATGDAYLIERAKRNADGWYAAWKKEPPQDLMSNVAIARVLWLMADTETGPANR